MREADRAQVGPGWRMEGSGGPAQPSPRIGQCLNGNYGWLEVQCHRWETLAQGNFGPTRYPTETPVNKRAWDA
jgi:hypothetical protein